MLKRRSVTKKRIKREKILNYFGYLLISVCLLYESQIELDNFVLLYISPCSLNLNRRNVV